MDKHTEQRELVKRGLAAWQRGEVTALADLLDADVELMWWTPGDWDCHGRDQVVALLSERARAGTAPGVDITDVDETTVLVERRDPVLDGPEAGLRPATMVRIHGGRVTHLRQYRSRQEALADAR